MTLIVGGYHLLPIMTFGITLTEHTEIDLDEIDNTWLYGSSSLHQPS